MIEQLQRIDRAAREHGDALVSSLVACAAATDSTFKPLVGQRGAAQREGWIHLPQPGSLESLAPAAVHQRPRRPA